MKRKISDMIDGLRISDVEIRCAAPLSAQRIKELTMSQIEEDKQPRRVGFRVMMAAAIIATLVLSVFAAEGIFGAGNFFSDIINSVLKGNNEYVEENDLDVTVRETISEGQIDVINALGKVFEEQSQTSEGTTMTLTAAYADDNMIHLYFMAEAPEGTVLPDDIEYTIYDYHNDVNEVGRLEILTLAEDAPYEMSGYFLEVEPLPDNDPTDHKKNFHITIKAQSGSQLKFNDGVSKYLNITGIYAQVPNVDGDTDGYVRIAPGRFTFDIGVDNEMERITLDVNGFTYGGEKTETWTHDSPCMAACAESLTGEMDATTGLPIHTDSWTYSVAVRSLTLSPLSAEWEVAYQVSNRRYGCSLSFEVVMKDGTSPLKSFGGGTDNGAYSTGTTYFSTPIDFDEVDYILIGDEEIGETYKIYLPEAES